MVVSVKHDFEDMNLNLNLNVTKGSYGKTVEPYRNRVGSRNSEDCVLELTTQEGARSKFILNEICGRYYIDFLYIVRRLVKSAYQKLFFLFLSQNICCGYSKRTVSMRRFL